MHITPLQVAFAVADGGLRPTVPSACNPGRGVMEYKQRALDRRAIPTNRVRASIRAFTVNSIDLESTKSSPRVYMLGILLEVSHAPILVRVLAFDRR